MRTVIPIIALTAGAILIGSGCKEEKIPERAAPAVTVQPAMKAVYKTFTPSISNIRAYDSVDLVARVQGFLQKCNFQEGQEVKKGQLLYQIEPDQYEAAVSAAEADLAQAKAKQKKADEDFQRYKTLLSKEATAKKNFEAAESEKMQADAEVMAANAKLKQAKLNLSYTKIFAPFDGRISFRTYSVGNLVGPESGKLATVLRSGPVKVDFRLNELDMLEIMSNREYRKHNYRNIPVELFFQNGRKYKLTGRIDSMDNRVNESTGTFNIRAVFDNPDYDLIPGMYVKVRIPTAAPKQAVSVPLAAMQSDMSGDYVYVVTKDNTVECRNIKGHQQDGTLYITSGVREQENVIVEGVSKVQQGAKVTPRVQTADPGAAR